MADPTKSLIESEYVYRGIKLPCDVRIPPNTVIRAGCSLSTLLAALDLPGRPQHFAAQGKPS